MISFQLQLMISTSNLKKKKNPQHIFVWFVVDAKLKVFLQVIFQRVIVSNICKKHTLLVYNLTMTSPHEINPERWIACRLYTEALFYQIALLRHQDISAINGSIIRKNQEIWFLA